MADENKRDRPHRSADPSKQETNPSKRETPMREDARSPDPEGRRDFLKRTGAGLLAATFVGRGAAAFAGEKEAGQAMGNGASAFRSRWPADVERFWIGPEYWANPLQDWRLSGGRLELVGPGPGRNVHLLTRELAGEEGTLQVHVQVGFVGGRQGSGQAGFEVGIQGPLREYRNNAIHGSGLKAGLTSEGRLFIEGGEEHVLEGDLGGAEGVALHLAAAPAAAGYMLALSAHDPATGEALGQVRRSTVPAGRMEGNVALFAGYDEGEESSTGWGTPRVWFRDWQAGGSKLKAHAGRAFGPILFAQHTLSRGVMKMTAQMPPLGTDEEQTVQFQLKPGGHWETVAEEPIHALSRTATFRITGWDDTRDVPYRLVYRLRQAGGTETHDYRGTVRKDPVDTDPLVMGVLTCATDPAFPNQAVAEGLREHDTDLLAFTGDQFYESSGGYGVERRRDDVELSTLDYLYKWYLHGWAFGDLMRERPTICMPDDHDVFQGNLWGEGGKRAATWEEHNNGGYFMPAEWVNMVQRTQTSHLPDPYDPEPVKQGITVYYTDMRYGRVSFAIIEDRKWKSGPDGLVPPNPGRPDHITDPDYDVTRLDVPGATLLGERQLDFLEEWTADWRGADVKVVVSQTAFAQVPNLHGRDYMYLKADLDANGWPQTPRDEALRRFRKGYAFHVGGDQHLPMVLRYGIDDFDDAGYIFCVPAIATGYPRAFEPRTPGLSRAPGAPRYTGRFLDGLGNKITVEALANPKRPYREGILERQADKVSGYGIVRIDRAERTFTMEAWPLLSDPRKGDEEQYTGWPQTVQMEDNYGRVPQAYLPTLVVHGATNPMVQVVDDEEGEVVYTLRIKGQRFRPKVFREGRYTIRVGDDEAWRETIEGVRPAGEGPSDTIEVNL